MTDTAHLNSDRETDSTDGQDSEFASRDLTPADLAELAPEVEAVQSVLWEGMTDPDTEKTLLSPPNSSAVDGLPNGSDRDIEPYLAMVTHEAAIEEATLHPDQNVVEDLAVSAGITMADKHPLHTNDMLEQRDSHRWELEPESAEDYQERD